MMSCALPSDLRCSQTNSLQMTSCAGCRAIHARFGACTWCASYIAGVANEVCRKDGGLVHGAPGRAAVWLYHERVTQLLGLHTPCNTPALSFAHLQSSPC